MAKPKKRKKVKRRSKGGSKSGGSSEGGGSSQRGKGGAMMGMRSGFKDIAGSVVGKQASSKRSKRAVDIFWWVITIALGIAAAVLLYNRFGR